MKTIRLKGPGKNALGTELMTWIIAQLKEANGEAVLLTGDGDTFSAGLNLKEIVTLDLAGMTHFLDTLERMLEAVFHYPGPTVAWVNGHAIAGGCILAQACDHRLMVPNLKARIGVNEVPLGLRFPPKTWRVLKSHVPPHYLDRVVLEGGLYTPDVALRLGLIDEIFETEAQAAAFTERVALSPSDAYLTAKKLIRDGKLEVGADEQRRFVAEAVPQWVSPDLKAKIKAMFTK